MARLGDGEKRAREFKPSPSLPPLQSYRFLFSALPLHPTPSSPLCVFLSHLSSHHPPLLTPLTLPLAPSVASWQAGRLRPGAAENQRLGLPSCRVTGYFYLPDSFEAPVLLLPLCPPSLSFFILPSFFTPLLYTHTQLSFVFDCLFFRLFFPPFPGTDFLITAQQLVSR